MKKTCNHELINSPLAMAWIELLFAPEQIIEDGQRPARLLECFSWLILCGWRYGLGETQMATLWC